MKIAWFTPFCTKSAIGHYSKTIAEELAHNHEVDIWSSEEEDFIGTAVNIVQYSSGDTDIIDRLKTYDIAIYNMGDCLPYHDQIFDVMQKFPGIVILHDYVMHHFFSSYCFRGDDPEMYYSNIGKYYSKETADSFRKKAKSGESPWEKDEYVIRTPLFEPVIANAYGVIVHSGFLYKKVTQIHPNTFRLFLPFTPPPVEKPELHEQFIITSVGNLNPNKNIDKIIKVFGKYPKNLDNVIFQIIGEGTNPVYKKSIQDLIHKYHLENRVKLMGYLSEKEKMKSLWQTDVFINLRSPAMEGASISLLEEMSYGKPVLVYDTGCYAEIPDNCVYKMAVNDELSGIVTAINTLQQTKIRSTMGKSALKYIQGHHQVKLFCKKISGFIDDVVVEKPKFQLIDGVKKELDTITLALPEENVDLIASKVASIIA